MKFALTVALALVVSLFALSPIAAQSKVADIYAEMARNAARAAQARADIYAKMVADVTAAAAAIPMPARVAAPVYVAPPAEVAPAAAPVGLNWFERNAPGKNLTPAEDLAETLAYEKVTDLLARRIVAGEGLTTAAFADCGIKPIKPIPPIGCHDLVAQCIVDHEGHAYWQWVCVK